MNDHIHDLLPGYTLHAVRDDGGGFILSDGETTRVVTDGCLMPPRPLKLAVAHGGWRAPDGGDPGVLEILSTVRNVIAPGERDTGFTS